MAPEYLVRGQLTEKADVYAFGVLVLEVACGRKNSAFSMGSSSILNSVRFILNRQIYFIHFKLCLTIKKIKKIM